MNSRAAASGAGALAACVAGVQFLLALSWVTYAVFLPRLLESAGLPPAWAPALLLADQFVFGAMDIACGVAVDRMHRLVGRLGPFIAGWTLLSCAAFLLLPHLARPGAWAAPALLAATLVWTTTSSALRAPAFAMLGRHAARPALPALNAVVLAGLAAAGAVAPWLGAALKGIDPRVPFAAASAALAAATLVLAAAERRAASGAPDAAAAPLEPRAAAARPATRFGWWLVGVLLLAVAFQVHTSINAAPLFLRFAPAERLEQLLPVFWAAFALGLPAAAPLCRRLGALPVMGGGAAVGALAALAATRAGSLAPLLAAQAVAGLAWAHMMVAAFSAAPDYGRTGREARALGALFAMLALATLARIGATIAGWPRQDALAGAFSVGPALLWLAAAVLLAVLARRAKAAA